MPSIASTPSEARKHASRAKVATVRAGREKALEVVEAVATVWEALAEWEAPAEWVAV